MPLPHKIILIGAVFNRLTVIGPRRLGSRRAIYPCRCVCGCLKDAEAFYLRTGRIQSCGCLHIEILKSGNNNRSHGQASHSNITTEYRIWSGMKKRCNTPTAHAFASYGGRGISVCARWDDSFENFLTDMGPRPSKNHCLERVNNDGNYTPANVIWGTYMEQASNRRSVRWISYQGETKNIAQWARHFSINYYVFHGRLKLRQWDISRALTSVDPSRRPAL